MIYAELISEKNKFLVEHHQIKIGRDNKSDIV